MEVKGHLISAPDPLSCPDRKQKERMAELLERRRSLQALLSTRLAELRCICLQEAELTGAVPSDFPLEKGEEPPSVRRRGGASRNRKCRAEDEDCQRSKRKTLFSAALRKHSDPEHNTHTHTHHGKRTVHRGCHTDDTVRSGTSSTSGSPGLDHDGRPPLIPPLVSAGSPVQVQVYYQTRTRRNSLHRSDPPEPLPPPPHSQDSSLSSDHAPHEGEGGVRGHAPRHSNSSDGLLLGPAPQEEEGGAKQGGLWVNGGAFRSSETLSDVPARGGGEGGVARRGGDEGGVARRGGGYDVLLDYVWGKQQLQRNRQPITAQLYNGHAPSQAPPTYRHHGDQRQAKVTRTKSCGPFLSQADAHNTQNPPLQAIQPDPHPHLLPPRPPQGPPAPDPQLEKTTRSLHKALALEGLRDWYLRNTLGSAHHGPANGKVNAGVNTKGGGGAPAGGGGALPGGGGALPGRRRTHGVLHPSTGPPGPGPPGPGPPGPGQTKKTLPHSATFHGQTMLGRSVDFPPHRQDQDQPSPGTLV